MKRCVVAVVVFLLAVRGSAHAEPHAHDPVTAQTLFYKARALMQQGMYADACPKLEESVRLGGGVGTQFNLADCNEHLGKIATAWAGFVAVAADAKAKNQVERESVARKRAQALEGRLPKLVVEVSGALPGLEIARDGTTMAPSAYGTAVPVDPGVHHITATAPGKQTWEENVNAAEAKTARVTVPRDLPAAIATKTTQPPAASQPTSQDAVAWFEPTASGASATAAVTSAPAEDAGEFPRPVVERSSSPQRIAGWVLAGAGALGVGVGAGFGLASIGDRNDSRSHCTGDQCDADGVSLRDDAIRHGNIATVSMIAGGAAIAGGLILVLTAPRGVESPERSGKLRAVPNVATQGGGLLLQGSFR